MLLAVSLTYALASGVLKPLFARPRPHVALTTARAVEVLPPTSYSFPSGHAATAVAGAIAGARVLPSASWLLWTLAALMSVSRIYVGVRYPSDLVAGALLGAACAYSVLGGRHPATWVSRSPAAVNASTGGVRVRP